VGLEWAAGRDSFNSSRPLSLDDLAAKAKQSERREGRAERRRKARVKAKELSQPKPVRRPGKQPGTPGTTLGYVTDPDEVVDHVPGLCDGCGHDLGDAAVNKIESRQVHDLPVRSLTVPEHRAEARQCECGISSKASFPAPATAAACYGPALRAVGVYLLVGQHLPVARTADLLKEICGAPVSTGWLASLATEAAGGLDTFVEVLRQQLISEDVIHADETGARISGAQYWFDVACTDLITLLECHPKRGTEAVNDIGVLPFFGGVLVSDGWKPYWSLPWARIRTVLRSSTPRSRLDRRSRYPPGLGRPPRRPPHRSQRCGRRCDRGRGNPDSPQRSYADSVPPTAKPSTPAVPRCQKDTKPGPGTAWPPTSSPNSSTANPGSHPSPDQAHPDHTRT